MSGQEAPAETGQAAEEAAPAENGQATEQATWFDSAPDEIKGYIQNKGWDDPIKAVTSYQELEKFRGASEDELIRIPKGEDGWDDVYTKLGRPESPDKYQAPEGMDIDDQRFSAFKEVAHKIGLNNEQVMALVEADSEYGQSYMQQIQEQRARQSETELADLERSWGSDAFKERTEMARRVIRESLPDGLDAKDALSAIEDAVGSANMVKFFSNIAEKSGGREDKIPDGDGDRPFGYTKEQALADKKSLQSELSADPKRLANYNKGIGPDYEKMQSLLKRLSS